ncbi:MULTISPECIES: hypothetical protein [unclassified Paenibacillus]|uniref:hypothetical protein n=1 Tax=unclassified Paenibacillus TaxID=185978 RepID=UPI00020D727D|nr:MULTISPECIES: hypothetical protein [unclassified Paenibacillus]EGL17507.1 hypothetical protein HMPREF9413_5381 [Paenibacillus sp. HGF7]EPD81290.1 hypothetical protein HMPREF1207_05047 [Paenibacillus sp. HGH0039]
MKKICIPYGSKVFDIEVGNWIPVVKDEFIDIESTLLIDGESFSIEEIWEDNTVWVKQIK